MRRHLAALIIVAVTMLSATAHAAGPLEIDTRAQVAIQGAAWNGERIAIVSLDRFVYRFEPRPDLTGDPDAMVADVNSSSHQAFLLDQNGDFSQWEGSPTGESQSDKKKSAVKRRSGKRPRRAKVATSNDNTQGKGVGRSKPVAEVESVESDDLVAQALAGIGDVIRVLASKPDPDNSPIIEALRQVQETQTKLLRLLADRPPDPGPVKEWEFVVTHDHRGDIKKGKGVGFV